MLLHLFIHDFANSSIKKMSFSQKETTVNLRLIALAWFNAHPPLSENLTFCVFFSRLNAQCGSYYLLLPGGASLKRDSTRLLTARCYQLEPDVI